MVGFSGAVEDGARNVGVVIALVVAVALGWAYGSLLVGVGAFVAGSLIATLWAAHAGENFRARQLREADAGPRRGRGEGAGEDPPSDRGGETPPSPGL